MGADSCFLLGGLLGAAEPKDYPHVLTMQDRSDTGFVEYDVNPHHQEDLSPRTLSALYRNAAQPQLPVEDSSCPRDQSRPKPRFFRSALPIDG